MSHFTSVHSNFVLVDPNISWVSHKCFYSHCFDPVSQKSLLFIYLTCTNWIYSFPSCLTLHVFILISWQKWPLYNFPVPSGIKWRDRANSGRCVTVNNTHKVQEKAIFLVDYISSQCAFGPWATTLQHKPSDTSGNVNKPVIWRKTVCSILYHFLCVQRVQGWHTLYHCMPPTFTTNISTIAIFSIFMFKVIGLRWIVMMTSAHPPTRSLHIKMSVLLLHTTRGPLSLNPFTVCFFFSTPSPGRLLLPSLPPCLLSLPPPPPPLHWTQTLVTPVG